jgi:hypothetical protein
MADYYNFEDTVKVARNIKQNVEKKQKLGENTQWSYFIAKQIVAPRKNVNKWYIKPATKSQGDYFSRQILKKDYVDMANRLIKYCDKNKQLPNFISVGSNKMKVEDYTYMFARVLVYYADHKNAYPNYAEANSKAFTKPSESTNDVYNYFVKVFGSFGDTIDGALSKISRRGYGYYYDDVYSNKQSIDRMKAGKGVNCTDSCQVFYNIMLALIKKGKYKKVECLHIKCSGGDGHVRLRITFNDVTKIYRDPACTLNSGGTCNWCMNGTLLGIDPYWFKQNLNR